MRKHFATALPLLFGAMVIATVAGCGSSGDTASGNQFGGKHDGGEGGATSQDAGAVPDTGSFLPNDSGVQDSSTNTKQEMCGNGYDDNGNGMVDEGCSCEPGQTQSCFSGQPAQAELGACKKGTQSCEGSGQEFSSWSKCEGEVAPTPELCDKVDNDCDGNTDEDGVCDGDECKEKSVTWGDCTADLPKAGDKQQVDITNTAPGKTGNAKFKCDNGTWVEVSGDCSDGCKAGAVTWDKCGGFVSAGAEGSTTSVNNTANPSYQGSATYKCVSGTWQKQSGTCDANTGTSCPAQGVTWDQCAGNLTAAASGQTQGVNNTTAGYTGSAQYVCNNGTWQKQSGTCNADTPTGCSPQSVTWGGHCTSQLGSGQNGQTQQVNDSNTTDNYVGSAQYKCTSGSWQYVNGSCGKKLCSYDWTGGGQWPIHTTGPFTKIYVMLANRSPEPPGLAYWDNSGYGRNQVTAFASCNEPMGEFQKFKDPRWIVKHIYQTGFHRTPANNEIDYWANQFATSCSDTSKGFGCFASCTDVRLGDFVMTIYNGSTGNDRKTIDNLVTVGEYWALQLVNHQCPWDPYGKTVLQQVNWSSSSVTSAKAGIDNKIQQMEQQQLGGSYPGAPACH